jgi:16S rRNA processing protein RimM
VGPNSNPSTIAIARIARTRGNRGEVLAELHTDFPQRFEGLRKVLLQFPDGRQESYILDHSWEHKGRQVLKLDGIDTIDAAETLVGAWVRIDAGEAVELPEGTYFDHDLVGCEVLDRMGNRLGAVKEVFRIEGNNLLVVESAEGEFWVPAKEPICIEVSLASKQIRVDLPDGLVELNR